MEGNSCLTSRVVFVLQPSPNVDCPVLFNNCLMDCFLETLCYPTTMSPEQQQLAGDLIHTLILTGQPI